MHSSINVCLLWEIYAKLIQN